MNVLLDENVTELFTFENQLQFPEDYENASSFLYSTMLNGSTNTLSSSVFFFLDLEDPVTVLEIVAFSLIILLTIGGNLLVIVAVISSPALRLPTHTLIVNLAIADLLLGLTVLPISATREVTRAWTMGTTLCSVWTFLDVLCCTASILSLCGISVDRYIGVSRPLAYTAVMTKTRVRILIALIWLSALAISIAPLLGWRESGEAQDTSSGECQVNKELGYVIFSACGSFYLPALVILVLYFLVYRAAVRHSRFLREGSRVTQNKVTLRVHMGSSRKGETSKTSICNGAQPNSQHQNNHQQTVSSGGSAYRGSDSRYKWHGDGEGDSENVQGRTISAVAGVYGRAAKFRRQKKAAKTLGIVVGGFLLCWFPFFLILPIDAACQHCNLQLWFDFAFWLGYLNSSLNPFIYACSSRELRRAFRSILCCRRRQLPHRTVSSCSLRSRAPSVTPTSKPPMAIS